MQEGTQVIIKDTTEQRAATTTFTLVPSRDGLHGNFHDDEPTPGLNGLPARRSTTVGQSGIHPDGQMSQKVRHARQSERHPAQSDRYVRER